jgi:hypothetical protein
MVELKTVKLFVTVIRLGTDDSDAFVLLFASSKTVGNGITDPRGKL